jgi:hypothetical protein
MKMPKFLYTLSIYIVEQEQPCGKPDFKLFIFCMVL